MTPTYRARPGAPGTIVECRRATLCAATPGTRSRVHSIVKGQAVWKYSAPPALLCLPCAARLGLVDRV